MTQHNLTTPFGRRSMSLAMAASQMAARDTPPESAAHKWQVFRNICEARELLGPSDRTLVVLNALLTFLPETVMTPESGLIVFPSNNMLATRAHGMAPATLRRHLAVLVTLGFVIRRDSPNGKRYARKGKTGTIETAYGFDLTPLVQRAEEFAALAAQVADNRRQRQSMRERITLARRNCAKLLETGADLCLDAAWETFLTRYRTLAEASPRSAGMDILSVKANALDELQHDIASLLENKINCLQKSGNESQTERHIHNSDKEIISIKEEAKTDPAFTPGYADAATLITVLEACPDINDYANGSIRSWKDLQDAASIARAALGVAPDAWEQFRRDAGCNHAAMVIAAMLQRRDHISRPGGYLRALNDKLRAGQFSIKPMIQALSRARLRQAAHTGTGSRSYAS